MVCRITDLRCKEVINVRDGVKIGYVDDVEIDSCTATVISLVIYGRSRFFGLLGRCEDTVIPWSCIEIIGEDIILVKFEFREQRRKKKSFGDKMKDWF